MIDVLLPLQIWQFRIRYYLSRILSYFRVAFHTQNCAVINRGSTSKFFGRYRNGTPFTIGDNRFATPSTYNPIKSFLVYSSLSLLDTENNSPHEIHNSPPSFTWRLGRAGHDWFGYQNGVWTGLHIEKISSLFITNSSITEFKVVKLKHPSYSISFCPNVDTTNICDLVGCPTLIEARKLAEWYYEEWLNVNHNFDTQVENLYSLAKRLGGRVYGNSVRKGDNKNGG